MNETQDTKKFNRPVFEEVPSNEEYLEIQKAKHAEKTWVDSRKEELEKKAVQPDLFFEEPREVCKTKETELRKNLKIAKKDEEVEKKLKFAIEAARIPEQLIPAFSALWLEMHTIICFFREKKKGKFGLVEKSKFQGWSLHRACFYLFVKYPNAVKHTRCARMIRELGYSIVKDKYEWFHYFEEECKGRLIVEALAECRSDIAEVGIEKKVIKVSSEDVEGDCVEIIHVLTKAIKTATKLPWCLTDAEFEELMSYYTGDIDKLIHNFQEQVVDTGVFLPDGYTFLKQLINAKVKKYMEEQLMHPIEELYIGGERKGKATVGGGAMAKVHGKVVQLCVRRTEECYKDLDLIPTREGNKIDPARVKSAQDRLKEIREKYKNKGVACNSSLTPQ